MAIVDRSILFTLGRKRHLHQGDTNASFETKPRVTNWEALLSRRWNQETVPGSHRPIRWKTFGYHSQQVDTVDLEITGQKLNQLELQRYDARQTVSTGIDR